MRKFARRALLLALVLAAGSMLYLGWDGIKALSEGQGVQGALQAASGAATFEQMKQEASETLESLQGKIPSPGGAGIPEMQEPAQEPAQDAGQASAQEPAVPGEVYVTFVDVGQGDAALIIDEGQAMLIDTGDSGGWPELESVLAEKRVQGIDALVLTHPDADHIGNAPEIIRDWHVKTVYMPDVGNDTQAYREVQEAALSCAAAIVHPQAGTCLPFGNAEYQVLGPITIDPEETNADSLIIKLVNGRDSVLFTGDATGAETEECMAYYDMQAEIYKAAHHGSANKGCNSPEFLNAVDPAIAVISCAYGNDYGHPHRETMQWLERHGVLLYRTDLQGTIECVLTGNGALFDRASTAVYTNGEGL